MNYSNPPIVELWIGFEFVEGANTPPWGERTANAFLEQYRQNFPKSEFNWSREVKVSDLFNAPKVLSFLEPQLERVRFFNESKTRCLQLARNRLIYNWVKQSTEAEYPCFGTVLQEAMGKLAAYRSHFRPENLHAAIIHYVDRIIIPASSGGVKLDDFLRIGPRLPEELQESPFRRFGLRVDMAGIKDRNMDDQWTSLMQEIISPPNAVALRQEWEYILRGDLFGENLEDRLRKAHDFAVECWEKCLTDSMRKIFQGVKT